MPIFYEIRLEVYLEHYKILFLSFKYPNEAELNFDYWNFALSRNFIFCSGPF
ncbi:hypothetical protein LEP1GSC108_2504 [Leptospira weilii str. UI 13098]|uniref:Uncharacterized protein n=1 Tax=Leptospira weilii str. UI 13098 TaxID=1088542 RepID=M6Q9E9_9LEPT|nr:hypothetical protein LEP1GSC108_2504 [Leptospira weilii str. UI 13098]